MLCHSSVSGLVVHLQVGYTKMLKIVLNQSRNVQSSDNNFAKAQTLGARYLPLSS